MKWYYILILLLIVSGLVFIKCSFFAPKIIYVFENNKGTFEFQSTNPDSAVKEHIDIGTMEINTFKNEPVYFHFIFSEATPNVEKLKSIELSLFGKNEKGEYKEYVSDVNLKIEYFDGKNIITKELKNNVAPLNTLVDWKTVNYTYEFLNKEYLKKNNAVTFTYSYHFNTMEYPDTLKLKAELVWENGGRKQEMLLHKEKYKGPKFNPKF
jgi:hypothetical protein